MNFPTQYFFFFLIGNKTFIEKKLIIMLMMENTLNKKQIQYNQELNEIETKKSDKEIQFVHPQIRAQ